ncbi:Candidapepsin-3 [Yarrowia sp. B02]|nr:Candidapepsin-3 [Yarrowia sp. B02]
MLFSTALLTFASLVLAAPSNPKVVTFPVTKHHRNSTFVQHHLHTRQIPESLVNHQAFYSLALSLGTPAQEFNLLLDTGSSDLWVYDVKDTTDCVNDQCSYTGQYDSAGSSTYNFLNNNYFIQYVSGNAYGSWVTDTLSIGDVTLDNFQFATVTKAGGDTGIVGISIQGQESLAKGQGQYPNFPIALKNAGYIDRIVYSLYLDSGSATTGTLLLGGIDTAKFDGSLVYLPLADSDGMDVQYNSISFNGQQISGGNVATLDSGTSLTYLPDGAFQALAKQLNLADQDDQGLYSIDCDADFTLEFDFGGVTISASSSNLIVTDGEDQCALGVLSTDQSQGYVLFGDTFLRNAYVVYDIEDSVIGIAQAKYTSASNIQPVTGPLGN